MMNNLKLERTKKVLIYLYLNGYSQKEMINYIKHRNINYISINKIICNIDLNDYLIFLESNFKEECELQSIDYKNVLIIKIKKENLNDDILNKLIR